MTKILYTWRKNNACHYGYYNTNSGVMVGKVTMQGRKWQASMKGFRPKSFASLNQAKRYVTDQTSKRLNNGS